MPRVYNVLVCVIISRMCHQIMGAQSTWVYLQCFQNMKGQQILKQHSTKGQDIVPLSTDTHMS